MDERKTRLSASLILYPLLFGVVALAFHLWRLDAKSVWVDEALTAWHSTFSLADLWSGPMTNKPPLYYLLTSWFWSPGYSAFALRLPAAILGAMVVASGWWLGRLLAGQRGAHLLALFLLLSDANLHYSQEARHYVLLMLGWIILMIAMAGALLRLPSDNNAALRPSNTDLLLWALGALLMVHAHPVGFIYLAASILAWVAGLVAVRRAPAAFLYLPLIITLLVMATLAPWLLHAIINASVVFDWLRQPTPGRAMLEWVSLFGAKNLALLAGRTWAIAASFALFAISLGGILHYFLRRDRGTGVWLTGLFVFPVVMLWLTGLVKPVYMLRTLSPVHIVAMTGLMLAVCAWPRRVGRSVFAVVIALLLASSSLAWSSRYQKEDWRGLSAQLAANVKSGDVVLLCESALYQPVWFYLGEDTPVMIDLDYRRRRLLIREPGSRQWKPVAISPLSHPMGAIWAINRYRHCPDNMAPILHYLTGNDYTAGASWKGQALTLTPYRPESR